MQSDVTTAISCDALLDSGGGAKNLLSEPRRRRHGMGWPRRCLHSTLPAMLTQGSGSSAHPQHNGQDEGPLEAK